MLAGGDGGWLQQEATREYNQIQVAAYADPNKLYENLGYLLPCDNACFDADAALVMTFAADRTRFVLSDMAADGYQLPSNYPALNDGGVVNAAALVATAAGGLASVLLEGADWRTAVAATDGVPELHILPAGAPSRRATDLIGKGLVPLLDEAVQTYDLVIVDAPPTLGFAEPLEIATIVDGVIVVARAGETERKAVSSVLASLQRLRANIVGVVLNQIQKNMADTYHYYGYYGKYYHYRESETNV